MCHVILSEERAKNLHETLQYQGKVTLHGDSSPSPQNHMIQNASLKNYSYSAIRLDPQLLAIGDKFNRAALVGTENGQVMSGVAFQHLWRGVVEAIILAYGNDHDLGIGGIQESRAGGGFAALMGIFKDGGLERQSGLNQFTFDWLLNIAST